MNLLHHSAVEEREFHFWTGDRFQNHLKIGRLSPHRPPRSLLDDVDGGDDSYSYTPLSPLLPHRRNCSSTPLLSPCSRTREIEHGGNELMEMIRHLPESSFELSLKDIVVGGQKNLEDASTQENDSDLKEQQQKRKKRKQGKPRVCQISRCSSMESKVFLIKLFPAFLTSKKTRTNPTKVLPRVSSNSKICRKDSGGKAVPGCWPFEMGKHKLTRQKTCIF